MASAPRAAAVTLALRGERVPLRNAVSSVYNPAAQQLLIVSGPALSLYSKLLDAGGEVVATLHAEPNVQFQFALYLAWLNAYSVVAAETNGRVTHRIVSADLATSTVSHVITSGTFFTATANAHRRELITADSDGGLKVWALRASTSSAAAVGGLKGILRVHTMAGASRKPLYQQLCLAAHGQRILARTSRKIHVIDAAACTLQSSCSPSGPAAATAAATIERMEYGVADDCVYLVFRDTKRTIGKFHFVQKKANDVVLKKASEQTLRSDSMAFCCTDDSSSSSSFDAQRAETPGLDADEAIRGLVVLDDCGQLCLANFPHPRQPSTGVQLPQLGLQINPLAERYIALHSELRPRYRSLVFLVCSSGFYIVEVFLPRSDTRLVVTAARGERMQQLETERPTEYKVAVYQSTPTPRVMLLDSANRDFHSVHLRVPGILQSAAESAASAGVRLVDLAFVNGQVVVLWSSGMAQAYAPSDDRMRVVAQAASTAPRATAMAVLHWNCEPLLALGDASGAVAIVSVAFDASRACGKRDAHSESVAALCAVTSNSPAARSHSLSLASVSSAGEVKLWLLVFQSDSGSNQVQSTAAATLSWELQVCFRTCATGVSAARLLQSEFLFCGFESGSVECWRLPLVSSLSAPSQGQQQQQQSTARIAVVKRPLHAIDLHLVPVVQITGEPNDDCASGRAQQPTSGDAFSWVVSVDQDGLVLVWCFSLELFFPHRRIKVHDSVRGCYLTRTPDASYQSFDALADSAAAAVRIRITLPGVEANETKKRYDARSPVKRPPSSRSATCIDVGLLPELDDAFDVPSHTCNHVEPLVSRHPSPLSLEQHATTHQHQQQHASALVSPVLHTPAIVAEQAFVPKVDTSKPLVKTDSAQTLAPVLSSVPSTFSKAKPRIYRSRFRPADALAKQTQCNVVTTGASAEDGAMADVDNQHAARDSGNGSSKRGAYVSYGSQEKVAVVSLTDVDDASVLMLDFRATTRRRRDTSASNNALERASGTDRAQFSVRFVSWAGMTEQQRRVELMAATKSRCVHEAAARDEIAIPRLDAFASTDVKVQLAVHAFARWFAATHDHHQWIRERFLLEELAFAGADPVIHSELTLKGLSVPSPECIGVSSSSEWRDFVLWYASSADGSAASSDRLEARTRYLQHRLEVVRDVEEKLRSKRQTSPAAAAAGRAADADQAYVFEDFRWTLSEESEDVMSWDRTSRANREKEVALALLDPDVQVAAMTSEIELPDLSGASLEDFDLLALAGKFVPWWQAAGNQSRLEFLNREVEEAAADDSIRTMVAHEVIGPDADSSELSSDAFFRAYFSSDDVRLTFLKRKLFYMKRKSRIASVAKYGKPPEPVAFETLPRPLASAFVFPELELPRDEPVEVTDDAVETRVDVDERTEVDGPEIEVETAPVEQDVASGLDTDDDRRRAALELELMATEDDLSREYNAQMVESDDDDDDDGKSLTPPKRTDFSRSYFFGNLPQRFRLPSSGWHSGSGIDNGDEEIEEEERLEQERERQRLLDQQEAERLAEEERRAERARLEKEKEDRALQMRRVRQLELRKVLTYQSELEARRREEVERQRIAAETKRMADEETAERRRVAQIASELAAMQREDHLSRQVQRALRDAVAQATRRQLQEQALLRAEDARSAAVEHERAVRERDERERELYLTELYTSFEPFFASTNEPSEDFLPSIQRRCAERERRRRSRLQTAPYTVSYAETLVLNDVEHEPYVARDSRKFNVLMGLPVRTAQRRKRSHASSERAASQPQPRTQAFADDEDRVEATAGVLVPRSPAATASSPLPALTPQRIRQPPRRARLEKPPLPDVSASKELLSDISAPVDSRATAASRASTARVPSESNQRVPQQQLALPFFRGNMLVRGEAKQPARAKDYAYRSG